MGVENFSGISWLHDKLIRDTEDRMDHLAHKVAHGVSSEEYWQMVGRYKEAKRFMDYVIPEIFKDFYQSDDEEDSDV